MIRVNYMIKTSHICLENSRIVAENPVKTQGQVLVMSGTGVKTPDDFHG